MPALVALDRECQRVGNSTEHVWLLPAWKPLGNIDSDAKDRSQCYFSKILLFTLTGGKRAKPLDLYPHTLPSTKLFFPELSGLVSWILSSSLLKLASAFILNNLKEVQASCYTWAWSKTSQDMSEGEIRARSPLEDLCWASCGQGNWAKARWCLEWGAFTAMNSALAKTPTTSLCHVAAFKQRGGLRFYLKPLFGVVTVAVTFGVLLVTEGVAVRDLKEWAHTSYQRQTHWKTKRRNCPQALSDVSTVTSCSFLCCVLWESAPAGASKLVLLTSAQWAAPRVFLHCAASSTRHRRPENRGSVCSFWFFLNPLNISSAHNVTESLCRKISA